MDSYLSLSLTNAPLTSQTPSTPSHYPLHSDPFASHGMVSVDWSCMVFWLCHSVSKILRYCAYLLDCAERLALIRQQRAEAAKKREEEKAGNVLRSSFTGFHVFQDMNVFPTDKYIFTCFSQRAEESWSPQMIFLQNIKWRKFTLLVVQATFFSSIDFFFFWVVGL